MLSEYDILKTGEEDMNNTHTDIYKYIHRYVSPFGDIIEASDGRRLTGLWFEGQKYYPKENIKDSKVSDKYAIFKKTDKWLDEYFSGNIPDFVPPLYMEGTSFQMKVWDILKKIRYGETITYGEIADRLASDMNIDKMSAQAVGGAVGHNPIAIIVPCHRVVGKDGSLTGYAAGVKTKLSLLTLEMMHRSSSVE